MSFNFNARYVLLTYAQSDGLDPFSIVNHIASLRGECIVGRETHADGGTHLHAFVDFGRKLRTRRPDCFDVEGFHPNISTSYGNPKGGYQYAIKDGDVVAGGLGEPPARGSPESENIFGQIVLAETREEFWEMLRCMAPRLLLANFNSLSAYADWNYRVDPEPYRHDPQHVFDTSRYPELDQWAQKYIDWDASVSGRFISHPAPWGAVGLMAPP